MRFLVIQMVIIILVCIFIAALANLAELGFAGWILAGSTGHALFKIYKSMHNSLQSGKNRGKTTSYDIEPSDFSKQVQEFMFDDATELQDE